jgi:uncharacterized lipoprotein YajG
MRYSLIALAVCVVLASCTQPAVQMRHPATGEIKTCGPYTSGVLTSVIAKERKSSCIADYERQGYLRAPN